MIERETKYNKHEELKIVAAILARIHNHAMGQHQCARSHGFLVAGYPLKKY